MKTFSAAIQAKLDAGQITLTQCARIVRLDGTVYRMTSFNTDLTMSNSEVYLSSTGYLPTATEASSGFKTGTVDVQGILEAIGVDRVDIRAGLFDGARVYIFETDYLNPVEDDIERMSGFWGEVTIRNGYYIAEFIGLKDLLGLQSGRSIQAGCPAELFDTDCKLTKSPDAWAATSAYTVRSTTDGTDGSMVRPTTENGFYYICTTAGTSAGSEPSWPTTIGGTVTDGTVEWEAVYAYARTLTVTVVTDNGQFEFGTTAFPDDWFNGGYVTCTSGNNLNVNPKEVIDFANTDGEVTLIEAFPFTVEVGDTFELTVGCRKRFDEDCITKFSNEVNFQGFPHVPTTDRATKFGGQP